MLLKETVKGSGVEGRLNPNCLKIFIRLAFGKKSDNDLIKFFFVVAKQISSLSLKQCDQMNRAKFGNIFDKYFANSVFWPFGKDIFGAEFISFLDYQYDCAMFTTE